VTVRITTITEKSMTVSALTQKEAREKAAILSSGAGRKTRVIAVKES
jgi:hypothetical protein